MNHDFVDQISRSLLFQATNISKSFNDVPVLNDLSFSIYQGEHLRIVGANGSGKSALLKIIAAKSWPSSGQRQYYFEHAIIQSPIIARNFIRLVSPEDQERMVKMAIAMTVREFIATGMSDSTYPITVDHGGQTAVDWALKEFDLQAVEHAEHMNVSHGTLKRAIIARATISQPRLLVLDDALEGIDAQRIDLMQLVFRRLSETGTTIVFSENRPNCIPILPDSEIRIPVHSRPTERPHPRSLTNIGNEYDAQEGQESFSQFSKQAHLPKTEPQTIVTLQNASVKLAGKPILQQISLRVRAGEHWGLIGQNGSGKSTLARVIAGYQPIHGGSITYFDNNHRLSHWEIRTHCPLLSDSEQGRHVSYHTVFDVIASGFAHAIGTVTKLTDQQSLLVESVLEDLHLAALREIPMNNVSFGMRRVALFARSMILQPSLVLLDEFLSSLDDQNRDSILCYLAKAQKKSGMAIITVSHVKGDIPTDVTGIIEMRNGVAKASH